MKTRMTAHVDLDIAVALQRLAEQRKESVSAVMADLLARAVVVDASEWGESVVVPILEEVIRKEVSSGFNRLARLLVRMSLEAGTARGLSSHLLSIQPGMSRERAQKLGDAYWAEAVKRVKTPLEDLPELLEALLLVSGRTVPGEPPS